MAEVDERRWVIGGGAASARGAPADGAKGEHGCHLSLHEE